MKNTLEKYGRIIALLHTLLYTIHSYSYIGSSSVKHQNSTFHTIEFFPDGKRNRRTSHWQSYSNCFDETANCMITICQSNFDCIIKCKNSCFIYCIIITFLAKQGAGGSFVLLLIDKLSTVSHENGVYSRVLSTVDSAVDYSLLSRGLQVYTVKLLKFSFFLSGWKY